jgi:hypothetical protein
MKNPQYDDDDVLLWGGRAIGLAIGKEQKPALRMLEQGLIKCAVKRGGIWTAWRRKLREEFGVCDGRGASANCELRRGG